MQEYHSLVENGELHPDPAQRIVVGKLDMLGQKLAGYQAPERKRRGLLGKRKTSLPDFKGLYVWGDVGRGKSMLMDMFFAAAPVARKRRFHFHAFMRDFHAALHKKRKKTEKDAVIAVAHDFADDLTLLCLDELQILDITDAMLVGRIFDTLFERGVVVVATSNRHPDDLYKDGLNRHLFVPFIETIKAKLDVVELSGVDDFRMREMERLEVYHAPLGAEATAAMNRAWDSLGGGDAPFTITHTGRDLVIPRFANGVGRGSFADFCEAPLGPNDYLQIASVLKVLILDDIPHLSRDRNNEAKRFVTLVDALYDSGVRLICSAAAAPSELYLDGPGAFEFRRTASRLEEMQSAKWGAQSA